MMCLNPKFRQGPNLSFFGLGHKLTLMTPFESLFLSFQKCIGSTEFKFATERVPEP